MQKLLKDVQAAKILTRVIARDQHPGLLQIEAEIRRLSEVVDRFYALLGERNWIYHEDLPVPMAERIVAMDVGAAERALMDFYRETDSLRPAVRRLARFPELRARMHLVELAEEDYHAGRYYAAIQVLLSVMDGFVNDLEPGHRRGLHAREADELLAWHSVVGHHLGLAHAHASFTKTFRKRFEDGSTELFRNGIVHGMVTDYNNEVVAAKAWNRLFAVADWATSRQRQRTEPKPDKSWTEILRTIHQTAETRRALDAWKPSSLGVDDPHFSQDEAVIATQQYLDAWIGRNYGHMASLLSPFFAEGSPGRTAGLVRESMSECALTQYSLVSVSHPAAAVATIDCLLTVAGVALPGLIRLLRARPDSRGAAPNEEGSWGIVTWSLAGMRKPSSE
jgi:hypothetical protein